MSVYFHRFERIADMVPRCETAADIGCDHGKLSALLLQRGRCERVIAADVSPFSVEKTLALRAKLHMEERMDVRLGSGFDVLSDGEAQSAVLAGLGGELIAGLIGAAGEKARSMALVLQPMQQGELLRKYLRENGWRIEREEMVEEGGRIHEMLLTVQGDYGEKPAELSTEFWDEIGPRLWERKEPLLAKRLRCKAEAVERRLKKSGGDTPSAEEGRKTLAEQIERYRWAIGEIEGN